MNIYRNVTQYQFSPPPPLPDNQIEGVLSTTTTTLEECDAKLGLSDIYSQKSLSRGPLP